MKKKNIFILIVVFAIIALYVVSYIDSLIIEYPAHNCITYFDEFGQYQLLYVGHKYYLFDAKIMKSLCSNVRYYLKMDNYVYLIYSTFLGGDESNPIYDKHYAILNIKTGELSLNNTKSEFEKFSIYEKNMIKLPLRKNDFEMWISDFIPMKYRSR